MVPRVLDRRLAFLADEVMLPPLVTQDEHRRIREHHLPERRARARERDTSARDDEDERDEEEGRRRSSQSRRRRRR